VVEKKVSSTRALYKSHEQQLMGGEKYTLG